MNEYLKYFETHAEYEAYINGDDALLPNVSYCQDNYETHYTPTPDPRLIITYTVNADNTNVYLYGYGEAGDAVEYFSKILIDGVEVSPSELDEAEGYYQFSKGKHIVKYTLIDPTTIAEQLFSNCIKITDVSIPSTIELIEESAFFSCRNLLNVNIPSQNNIHTIEFAAFKNCENLSSYLPLPKINEIKGEAFMYCHNIENIAIGEDLTKFGSGAFYGCYKLKDINIPNGVESIPETCFDDCSSLTSVTIPRYVIAIGDEAFAGCSGLERITVLNETPPSLGEDVFVDTNNCPIYVPGDWYDQYLDESDFTQYRNRLHMIQ